MALAAEKAPRRAQKKDDADLKGVLDALYRGFDFRGRLRSDPIEFPHRYRDPRDAEAAGFVASALAYGRVDLFKPVVERVLSPMGRSPHAFLLEFDPRKRGRLFSGVSYRFNRPEDITAFLYITGAALREFGSLEALFMAFHRQDAPHTGPALAGMMDWLGAVDVSPAYGAACRGAAGRPYGLRQLVPSPSGGSACKRANLFLRWMVRDRDIDLGLWRGVSRAKLIIPLDTHIARVSRRLGFTRRKAADWKAALEVTGALRRFDPEDPLKYDFALCHSGMAGAVPGKGNLCVL